MERGEPLWLDEDRSWALALIAYEDGLCDGCGHPLRETTAVKDGRPVHTYEVDDPDVCGACRALALKVQDYQEDAPAPVAALKYAVTQKT